MMEGTMINIPLMNRAIGKFDPIADMRSFEYHRDVTQLLRVAAANGVFVQSGPGTALGSVLIQAYRFGDNPRDFEIPKEQFVSPTQFAQLVLQAVQGGG